MHNIPIFGNISAKFEAILITGCLFFAFFIIPKTFFVHCITKVSLNVDKENIMG